MIGVRTALVVGVAAASIGHAAVRADGGDVAQVNPQVFRSRSTMVSVDVSVRSGNRSVTGLSAEDFELTDNGVLQRIELVELASVPVDVSLVVDLSGSTRGAQDRYRDDVAGIARIIREGDRLRVIAFSRDVDEILPLSDAGTRPPVERLVTGTSSSVFDGLAVALLRRVDLGRRHLIVAFTDGGEGGTPVMNPATGSPAINLLSGSIVSFADLAAIARRSEAVLHLSGSRNERLNAMAEDTGGGNHAGSVFRRSILREFEAIYAAFRQSYVLRYSPTGVPPEGWHEVAVSVTRPGKFEVRARRGYFGQ